MQKISMKKNVKESLIALSASLLILLFIYTGFDKLFDPRDYHNAMSRQPLPAWMLSILTPTLPYIEIAVALLLIPVKTRLVGLYVSTILMTAFTIYIAMGVIHIFKYVPCSCAGVFRNLTWPQHLLLNVGILIDAIFGILVSKISRKDELPPRQGAAYA